MQRNRARTLSLIVIPLIVIALLIGAYVLTQEDDQDDKKNTSSDNVDVTLFLGFVPNIQFAPLYVAAERGYFADEGINIHFENGSENDGVVRIATNDLQFGLVSGEQVVLARDKDMPVVYVFEWYHSFPVGIISPADLNIQQPQDLAGRVVGIPGPYGASYMGLRALLGISDMSESDLGELRSINYTAAENICAGQIDASVVYIANEPVKVQNDCGLELNIMRISDYVTLVSNGLVTNEITIQDNPDLVRGMVRAIQRGLADTLADPDTAFSLSIPEYVPDLSEDEYPTQRQVLENSILLWQTDGILGQTDPQAWEATQTALIETGLMENPLDDLAACYNMSFLP
jgi:NitT/TauT family transport system substrate-binding protein